MSEMDGREGTDWAYAHDVDFGDIEYEAEETYEDRMIEIKNKEIKILSLQNDLKKMKKQIKIDFKQELRKKKIENLID